MSNSAYDISLAKRAKLLLVDIKCIVHCVICLDFPVDPVRAKCSHHFCRDCLNRVFEMRQPAKCPLCGTPITKRNVSRDDVIGLISSDLQTIMSTVEQNMDIMKAKSVANYQTPKTSARNRTPKKVAFPSTVNVASDSLEKLPAADKQQLQDPAYSGKCFSTSNTVTPKSSSAVDLYEFMSSASDDPTPALPKRASITGKRIELANQAFTSRANRQSDNRDSSVEDDLMSTGPDVKIYNTFEQLARSDPKKPLAPCGLSDTDSSEIFMPKDQYSGCISGSQSQPSSRATSEHLFCTPAARLNAGNEYAEEDSMSDVRKKVTEKRPMRRRRKSCLEVRSLRGRAEVRLWQQTTPKKYNELVHRTAADLENVVGLRPLSYSKIDMARRRRQQRASSFGTVKNDQTTPTKTPNLWSPTSKVVDTDRALPKLFEKRGRRRPPSNSMAPSLLECVSAGSDTSVEKNPQWGFNKEPPNALDSHHSSSSDNLPLSRLCGRHLPVELGSAKKSAHDERLSNLSLPRRASRITTGGDCDESARCSSTSSLEDSYDDQEMAPQSRVESDCDWNPQSEPVAGPVDGEGKLRNSYDATELQPINIVSDADDESSDNDMALSIDENGKASSADSDPDEAHPASDVISHFAVPSLSRTNRKKSKSPLSTTSTSHSCNKGIDDSGSESSAFSIASGFVRYTVPTLGRQPSLRNRPALSANRGGTLQEVVMDDETTRHPATTPPSSSDSSAGPQCGLEPEASSSRIGKHLSRGGVPGSEGQGNSTLSAPRENVQISPSCRHRMGQFRFRDHFHREICSFMTRSVETQTDEPTFAQSDQHSRQQPIIVHGETEKRSHSSAKESGRGYPMDGTTTHHSVSTVKRRRDASPPRGQTRTANDEQSCSRGASTPLGSRINCSGSATRNLKAASHREMAAAAKSFPRSSPRKMAASSSRERNDESSANDCLSDSKRGEDFFSPSSKKPAEKSFSTDDPVRSTSSRKFDTKAGSRKLVPGSKDQSISDDCSSSLPIELVHQCSALNRKSHKQVTDDEEELLISDDVEIAARSMREISDREWSPEDSEDHSGEDSDVAPSQPTRMSLLTSVKMKKNAVARLNCPRISAESPSPTHRNLDCSLSSSPALPREKNVVSGIFNVPTLGGVPNTKKSCNNVLHEPIVSLTGSRKIVNRYTNDHVGTTPDKEAAVPSASNDYGLSLGAVVVKKRTTTARGLTAMSLAELGLANDTSSTIPPPLLKTVFDRTPSLRQPPPSTKTHLRRSLSFSHSNNTKKEDDDQQELDGNSSDDLFNDDDDEVEHNVAVCHHATSQLTEMLEPSEDLFSAPAVASNAVASESEPGRNRQDSVKRLSCANGGPSHVDNPIPISSKRRKLDFGRSSNSRAHSKQELEDREKVWKVAEQDRLDLQRSRLFGLSKKLETPPLPSSPEIVHHKFRDKKPAILFDTDDDQDSQETPMEHYNSERRRDDERAVQKMTEEVEKLKALRSKELPNFDRTQTVWVISSSDEDNRETRAQRAKQEDS